MEHNVPFATMQDMRADALEKRDAIITASRRLFAQEGFEVPFRTIASGAGVGVATVHRHFPDRFDLVMAVANNLWDEMEGIIHRHDSEWDRDAEQTLFSILSELAELHPLSFMAMGENVITSLDEPLDETNPIYKRALKIIGQLADNAKKHALLADNIDPLRFFGGFAIISRELPIPAQRVFPDYDDWMIRTYLKGIKP